MMFSWDEDKNRSNTSRHGVSFEAVHVFAWEAAVIWEDRRRDYGELRHVALGPIGDRLHVCVYSDRAAARRIISLRKANAREFEMYMGVRHV